MILQFTQMFKNQKICDVELDKSGCRVTRRYPDVQPYKLLFNLDSYSYDTALEILESRLWNKQHEYLTKLWQADRDNIISCIETTHGIFATDSIWFLFKDEQLRWEDVNEKC